MEDEIEAAFTSEYDKIARYNYLVTLLQDGGEYSGFYGNWRLAFRLYVDWEKSNYTVWPYPGGRLQQPTRITHDMDAVGYRKEFYELKKKMKSDAKPFDPKQLGV